MELSMLETLEQCFSQNKYRWVVVGGAACGAAIGAILGGPIAALSAGLAIMVVGGVVYIFLKRRNRRSPAPGTLKKRKSSRDWTNPEFLNDAPRSRSERKLKALDELRRKVVDPLADDIERLRALEERSKVLEQKQREKLAEKSRSCKQRQQNVVIPQADKDALEKMLEKKLDDGNSGQRDIPLQNKDIEVKEEEVASVLSVESSKDLKFEQQEQEPKSPRTPFVSVARVSNDNKVPTMSLEVVTGSDSDEESFTMINLDLLDVKTPMANTTPRPHLPNLVISIDPNRHNHLRLPRGPSLVELVSSSSPSSPLPRMDSRSLPSPLSPDSVLVSPPSSSSLSPVLVNPPSLSSLSPSSSLLSPPISPEAVFVSPPLSPISPLSPPSPGSVLVSPPSSSSVSLESPVFVQMPDN